MRHNRKLLSTLALAGLFASTAAANATIATVYDAIATGVSNFDAKVIGAGATVATDTWGDFNLTSDRGDYTVSRTDGTSSGTLSYGNIVGKLAGIDPVGTPGIGAINSGITFNFKTPINSFGLDVGDWGTCCNPSALYISFDDGAPIKVGLFDGTNNTGLGPNGAYEIFVGAFDDSGKFSKIQFWGDGFGEYLVAGGTIRYASLKPGSISSVPLPAAIWLFGSAIAGASAFGRSRRR